jgi:succinoglycan biosynthesis protein ExoA
LLLLAPFSVIFALPALSWALLCLGYGFLLGVRQRDPCAAAAGVAAIAMQVGWSVGFFEGLKAGLWRTVSRQVDIRTDKTRRPDRITQ